MAGTDHDRDDLLAPFDLTAWDAPPPPRGLADAVIARAKQPAGVGAIETGERPSRLRWWIAGGVVGALAAVLILVGIFHVEHVEVSGHGEVIADRARPLAIGPTTAALDPGTQVRWTRDHRRITVAQPRGRATWNVDAEDTLVIDAGAAVASVEATGASLRVEVDMNLSDARVIGVSAATAATVALVTVVVYEGHVKVTSNGQTVNVAPGATYEVHAPAPEPEAPIVGVTLPDRPALPPSSAGSSEPTTVPPVPADQVCDEASCARDNDASACCAKYVPAKTGLPESISRADIAATMATVKDELLACNTTAYVGNVKLVIRVDPRGEVDDVEVTGTPTPTADAEECLVDAFYDVLFPRSKNGAVFSYPVAIAAPAFDAATCDAVDLARKGDDHLASGRDAAALAAFEQSVRCHAEPSVIQKAYMAACRAKNATKARSYFRQLPTARQSSLAQICIRSGIDPTEPAPAQPACDADALRKKGNDHMATGMDAAALAAYEAALRCKAEPLLFRAAYMAACRSKNAVKARLYYAKLPPGQQAALAQLCIRQGMDPSHGTASTPTSPTKLPCQPKGSVDPNDTRPVCTGGRIQIQSRPAAKILLDGVDTRKSTPVTLEVTPGRHKVTFVIGSDKFTFAVTAEEGEVTKLIKDLE